MTKIVLTEDLKKQALQQYHPYINIDLWSLKQEEYDTQENSDKEIILQDTVNLKILSDDIQGLLSNKEQIQYQKYITKPNENNENQGDFTNIIFTPKDDLNIIIPYEYYKGVFYLQLPRFYRTISLHMLTYYFDASDDIVLFHTEDIIDYINNPDNPSYKILTTNDGFYSSNQDGSMYNLCAYSENDSSTVRYLIDLPQEMKTFDSLEIDVFYTYQNNQIDQSINEIGLIDTNDRGYEITDRTEMLHCQRTLMGVEHCTTTQASDTNIREISRSDGLICRNPETDDVETDGYFHFKNQINEPIELDSEDTNHKHELIIKYINDDIYIEQYNANSEGVDRKRDLQTNNSYNYIFTKWNKSLKCTDD